MFNKISHFIQYNNAIPIFLGVVFLGSGMAFAASEEVRDTVLSSQQELRSIDNGRIVHVDLDTYATAIEITNVTEDELFYFVAYNLHTIDLVDGVWQDVSKEQLLKVAKDAIVGKDLGTYATKELAQVRDSELLRLKATQEIERAQGLSSKTVATVYTGLVGKFLDEKSETIPGYVPVVEEQPAAPYPGTAADAATNATADAQTGGDATTGGSVIAGDPSDMVPPVISVLGSNPAYISLRTQYSDLGAYVYDNKQGELGYEIFLDGVKVQSVQIDTATTTSYTVVYKANDQVGNTAQATRIINVYDPAVTTPPTSSQQPTAGSLPAQTGSEQTTTGSGEGTTDSQEPAAPTTTDTEQPTATTTDNQQPAADGSQQTATTTDSIQEPIPTTTSEANATSTPPDSEQPAADGSPATTTTATTTPAE